MDTPRNVVPFFRDLPPAEPEEADLPQEEGDPEGVTLLGKLRRKDFELWICREGDGTLTMKWWRWREASEQFYPMEDGGLTLNAAELQPLAELLSSVNKVLKKEKGGPGPR
jgi:hypothetical protein